MKILPHERQVHWNHEAPFAFIMRNKQMFLECVLDSGITPAEYSELFVREHLEKLDALNVAVAQNKATAKYRRAHPDERVRFLYTTRPGLPAYLPDGYHPDDQPEVESDTPKYTL